MAEPKLTPLSTIGMVLVGFGAVVWAVALIGMFFALASSGHAAEALVAGAVLGASCVWAGGKAIKMAAQAALASKLSSMDMEDECDGGQ